MRRASLDELLENPRVWRGRNPAQAEAGIGTGYEKLDRHLPGGGWPRHSLTEILSEQPGIGELQLLMPALSRLSVDDPVLPGGAGIGLPLASYLHGGNASVSSCQGPIGFRGAPGFTRFC